MRWASSVSVEASFERAAEEALAGLARRLEGASPDLAVVFVSRAHAASWRRIPDVVGAAFPGALVFGCSAGGVIGGGREVEEGAALSVTAASLPGVELRPLRIDAGGASHDTVNPVALRARVEAAPDEDVPFLLLGDPFTLDVGAFLGALDAACPAGAKVGGLASGGTAPGENALFLGPRAYTDGLVGVALRGNVSIDAIVAQGCRPVGEPMFVTRSRRNVLLELDGKSPVDAVRELFERLGPRDRDLFRHSLFLGIVMDPHRERYGRGDFLIRNLVGVDGETGALAVGAMVEEGAVVQFHLRDAETSAEDLEILLARRAERAPAPAGALLFSCLGRGQGLYGSPDHDSEAFRRHLGDAALGGFFCNGEIGPVRGRTFLHGYTSSFALFR